MTLPNKASLRRLHLSARDAMDAHERDIASRACAGKLLNWLQLKPQTVVAGYIPLGSELNILPALEWLDSMGQPLALPVMHERQPILHFKRWRSGDPLIAGSYGVQQPDGMAEPAVPSILLVPLVAFDGHGHRIGYGKGYYDGTLRELRARDATLLAIGVAFSAQKAEAIPISPQDERLDAVVTENALFEFQPHHSPYPKAVL